MKKRSHKWCNDPCSLELGRGASYVCCRNSSIVVEPCLPSVSCLQCLCLVMSKVWSLSVKGPIWGSLGLQLGQTRWLPSAHLPELWSHWTAGCSSCIVFWEAFICEQDLQSDQMFDPQSVCWVCSDPKPQGSLCYPYEVFLGGQS